MNADQVPTYAELNAVLDRARRPSSSPAAITDAQLLGLQHRWTTMLSARLDQAIEDAGAGSLPDAVADAWHRLAADQPELRGVLDRGLRRGEPLADALTDELRMLALAADLVDLDAPEQRAVQLGRQFRELLTVSRVPLHCVA